MKRTRQNESGQAMVEMCTGLIGIMVVFSGMLFISGVGVESVRALITARENADAELGSAPASFISYWNYGEDEIPFSADDTPVSSSSSNQMASELSNNFINLTTDSLTMNHPFTTGAQSSDLFTGSVSLLGASGNQNDLDERLPNMMEAIETLFGIDDIDLTGQRANQVYMPPQAVGGNGTSGGDAILP